jgi:NAD(P)-dependent dehydrogenase (short-subunit alcohol dehydrogenase family)
MHVVSGGTTGIGFQIADNLAQHGANLSVASRKQENNEAAMAWLGTAGGNIVGVDTDVRDLDAGSPVFHSAAVQTWRHRPAGLRRGQTSSLPSRRSRRTVSAWSRHRPDRHFHLMRAADPHLTKPGAAVINIPRRSPSSRRSPRPAPAQRRLASTS